MILRIEIGCMCRELCLFPWTKVLVETKFIYFLLYPFRLHRKLKNKNQIQKPKYAKDRETKHLSDQQGLLPSKVLDLLQGVNSVKPLLSTIPKNQGYGT